MASPSRSSPVLNEGISGEIQALEISSGEGDLITASSSKRERDDDEDDDDEGGAEQESRGLAKRPKLLSHGALPLHKSVRPKVKKASAVSMFSSDIWMVILEHCTPATLRKMRGLSREFQALMDRYQNILVESRFQTYGLEVQVLPEGLSERQFSILLEGRGCMKCNNPRVTFTHWSWCKRWCIKCWEQQILPEDSAREQLKSRGIRSVFAEQILLALPWGLRDSWKNPHPLVEHNQQLRYRNVVKTFLKEELGAICEDFERLVPPFPVLGDDITTTEQLAILTQYDLDSQAVPTKRAEFLHRHTIHTKIIMEKALIIDMAVRAKQRKEREVKRMNREFRAEFFKERAGVDLPDIPAEWVKSSQAFLAATRIGKDRGNPRSWAILRTKIRREWNALNEVGMDKVIQDDDTVQNDHWRMEAVDEESSARQPTQIPWGATIEGVRVGEEQAEVHKDEEDEETVPHSIWMDRDLACEYAKYNRSLAEKRGGGEGRGEDADESFSYSGYISIDNGAKINDTASVDGSFDDSVDDGVSIDGGVNINDGFSIDSGFSIDGGVSIDESIDGSIDGSIEDSVSSYGCFDLYGGFDLHGGFDLYGGIQ